MTDAGRERTEREKLIEEYVGTEFGKDANVDKILRSLDPLRGEHRQPTPEVERKLLDRIDEMTRRRAEILRTGTLPPIYGKPEIHPVFDADGGLISEGMVADEHLPNKPYLREYHFGGPRAGKTLRLTNAMDEVDPEVVKEVFERFNKLGKDLAEALAPMIEQFRTAFQSINDFVEANPELFVDKPVHPHGVRDERGIPKPSNVVPFWANDPGRSRPAKGRSRGKGKSR
ncbi:hypothetical protein KNU02_gp06 [Gordonia phage Pleakley]|uniref:Uncharacterized protein n=1 Tax=Gordonia phage Pleakley TaxID=2283246 RepID=A0A345M6C4_9CAUD|nr:hypothetical protein KNU02_gp06 [Gordonia phage Pleakley]AXH49732.1 hypothetical protein SEA_FURY_6 [Gordonia phage Fury]AXH66045.1 hypothetical protein SEA_PLEAKLEY_6 [Gordonia phage Pleakley]